MAVVIVTPRPPLNLFEAVRANITSQYSTVYEVPEYLVPAEGPNPERTVKAAAIMTGILITPTYVDNVVQPCNISVRIVDVQGVYFPVIQDIYVPGDDFLTISLDRQVMLSGEKLELKTQTDSPQTASVSFSFILNQREEFTEIV